MYCVSVTSFFIDFTFIPFLNKFSQIVGGMALYLLQYFICFVQHDINTSKLN